MVPDPKIPEEDLRFGELAVSQGVCTRERLDECISLLQRLIETGTSPLPRLGELLVRKGALAIPGGSSPSESPDAPVPPGVGSLASDPANIVGNYVRTAPLGSGGMGEVWRAWDRKLRRWVALKFLRENAPEDLARFRREALTVATLNHPNIAAIYEVGDAEGRPYIALQYVEGRTLRALPRGDPQFLTQIVRDAALAVQYAHEQGFIHRDLKPDNLMVEEKSNPPRVYVMDFGLAKRTAVGASLSNSGSIVGTPSYMSPEQAGADRAIGPASDVYSLGATMYDLLAGHPPFPDRQVYDVLRKVREEEPVPLRKRNARVHRDLETIVMKCLEKRPERRYPSARTLAEDLDRWVRHEPIVAHPPSVLYRLRKRLSKRKALLAVGTALVITVLSAGLYWAWTIREARGWVREAQAKVHEGRYEEAKALLDRARARIAVDEPLYRLCESKLGEDRRRAEARKLEDEVMGSVQQRLEMLPNDAEGRRRAIQVLDEGLSKVPESSEGWMKKGHYHCLLFEFDAAFEAYRRALGIDPRRGLARIGRGDILWKDRHDKVGAIREYQQALEVASDVESRFVARTRMALLRGESEEVVRICAEAEAAGMRSELLHRTRGDAHSERREWDEAIASFGRAIAMNSLNAASYAQRGLAHLSNGQALAAKGDRSEASREYDASHADFDRAIGLDPEVVDGYVNRGIVCLAKGKLRFQEGRFAEAAAESRAAEREFTQAIGIAPDHAAAHFHRGIARSNLEDRDGALRDLDRVVAMRPGDVDAYPVRAEVRIAKGDLEEAISDWEAALRLAPPDWPDRERVESSLRKAKSLRKP